MNFAFSALRIRLPHSSRGQTISRLLLPDGETRLFGSEKEKYDLDGSRFRELFARASRIPSDIFWSIGGS